MNRSDALENEWYHVRYSGEIPEVAFHSSLHYLCEDEDGPGLSLTEAELEYLRDAAAARYRDIILRDLTPANRDTQAYRGVLRAICNWRRFLRFCRRHGMGAATLKPAVGEALQSFLEAELADAAGGSRASSINCNFDELRVFARELGVDLEKRAGELREICLEFS